MALAASVRIEIDDRKVRDFLSVSISQNIPGPHAFTVTFRMDTFEEPDDFLLNNSRKFIGLPIVIEIDGFRPGGEDTFQGLFFKGIICTVKAVKSDLSHEDSVVLQGYSPDYLLADHAGCHSYENKTLAQIVTDVLKPYPRDILGSKVNPSWGEQIPYCVRYRESSIRFLQRLATRYGEWIYYNGKELVFGAPASGTEDATVGKEIETLDFSLNLKASGFTYVAYDYMNARNLEASADRNTGRSQQNEIGQYGFDQSAKRFAGNAILEYPHLNADPSAWSKGLKYAMETGASAIALGISGIEGKGEHLSLAPGRKIRIKAPKKAGGGYVDYGQYLIISTDHYCDELLNYDNRFTAVPAEATVAPYADPEAVTRSEPQVAVVKDNKDPEKMGRVKVHFFWQGENQLSPWIRMVNPYSAKDRGFYFIPEIDDEVLVGFEGGDTEKPFVMGSLYNGKNKPVPAWPGNRNNFKGIATKSNLRIEFDDDKKETTITTPGGNMVKISDEEKSIILQDLNNNKVELSPGGILLDSSMEITLKAKSKISLEGKAGVEITSPADIKVSGLNVDHHAKVSYTASGKASAEVSASGTVTVKGAMVMIN